MENDARAYVKQMLIELADLADAGGEHDLARRILEVAGDRRLGQARSHDGHDGHAEH